ncbi:hypothetical protein VPHK251G3_0064 [Vibrio phage K251 g3]
MSIKQPMLCGRIITVCDEKGLNLMSTNELMFHITEHPMESELVLTSESYGFFCGVNMMLLPGMDRPITPRKVEATPGSSDASAFGAGLITGLLSGDL